MFVERTRLVSGIVEKHYRAAARNLQLDTAAFGSGDKPDRRRTEALLGFVFDQTRVEVSQSPPRPRRAANPAPPDSRETA